MFHLRMSKCIGDPMVLRGCAFRPDSVSYTHTHAIYHCMKTRWALNYNTRVSFDIIPLNTSATNNTLKTTEVMSMHFRIIV